MNPAMTFSGIPIYVSELLPNTKTVRWKTERKWCHWKNSPARRYRLRAKGPLRHDDHAWQPGVRHP
jgi:hypothetical protein